MPNDSNKRPVVMVSSTARDLPAHRKEVEDACLRQGMFPLMMERLPASDAEAISASLGMVDEADVYVGVFAHRYGYVPRESNPRQISVTEMEYERAVERNIPRQIFIIDKKQPLGDFTIDDIDKGESAERLAQFKSRVETENIVNYFKSPADLRAHVINSLSQLRKPDLTTFHYVSDIPEPPEPFIAHPYTLLQTHRLVGRQPELNLLADWVAKPDAVVYRARILNVVAVGGMGKSALTWKWFNDIAPQEMKPLAGRLWWSFYESDATFENFVTRALAYTTRRPLAEVQQIPAPDRESQLLHALDREPFLLVLDGLERILIAYARMDAARLEDSQVGTQRNLRKTADPRAGRFLKKLTQVRTSRALVSTRLYPAELETDGGDPIPASFKSDIKGLADEDAVEFWRALNVMGSRDLLLPVFATFGKHPLLIQALAGEVKRYRRAPGNFEEWRRANAQFDPTKFPLLQDAMSHVLEFALRRLSSKAQQVLQVVAAFRMPAHYDTLTVLLIGEGKPCLDERELDELLTELEDRGLVGWDKRANRYDLHPIVRGVVWSRLDNIIRRGIYEQLLDHFQSLPRQIGLQSAIGLADLAADIELFNSLIGLKRYDEAFKYFKETFYRVNQYHLGTQLLYAELLEAFFPKGKDELPTLSDVQNQYSVVEILAGIYWNQGEILKAAKVFMRCSKALNYPLKSLLSLSSITRLGGSLRYSESTALKVLGLARAEGKHKTEGSALYRLGLTLAHRGCQDKAELVFRRAQRLFSYRRDKDSSGVVHACSSLLSLWSGDAPGARAFAEQARSFAGTNQRLAEIVRILRRDYIRATKLIGIAESQLGNFEVAESYICDALQRARIVGVVEEEIDSLIALAELRRKQQELQVASDILDAVWEPVKRGPYRLFHADACNVLSRIEHDAGNQAAAIKAARKAYRLAWCDGPPFAYHWGLERARGLLKALGAGEPLMPAFDESKFEPMPEVEIDPADEFGAASVEGREGG
ncbi:MAG TPA: DUF4062 domain-containing protein [Pyrinomonadaceae bacterium]